MALRGKYVTDRRVGFTVEQLAVDPLHVVRARAVLDLEPAPRPLDVWGPGLGQSLVESLRAPVLRPLPEPVRGEEEDRLGAGELRAAAEVLAVGDADGRVVLELIAVVAVDGAADLGITGHVDVDGRLAV